MVLARRVRRSSRPSSLIYPVDYELLYWAMASMVALALLSGWLSGQARTLGTTLLGVLVWAGVAAVVVWVLTRDGAFAEQAPLLAIAAALFSLVIGAACALLARRIRARRKPLS